MAIGLAKRRVRERWNLKAGFWAMVAIVAFDFLLVCVILDRPLWQELEIASAFVGLFVWISLTLMLYFGVRMDRDCSWTYFSNRSRWDTASEMARGIDIGLPDFSLGDDPISLLLSLIFGLVAIVLLSVAIAGLLWLGLEMAYGALWMVFGALFVAFHWSLRWLIARHRRAERRWWPALWGGFKGGLLASSGFFATALLAWHLGGH
jgi:hypothetical protein